MKRPSRKRIPVHVTIPVRLLEDLDDTLSYKQSRSKVITTLIENHLKDNPETNISLMTNRQIVGVLQYRTDPKSSEYLMLQSLLQIFSK